MDYESKRDSDGHADGAPTPPEFDMTGAKGRLSKQTEARREGRVGRSLPTMAADAPERAMFGSQMVKRNAPSAATRERRGYQGSDLAPPAARPTVRFPPFSRLADRGYSGSLGVDGGGTPPQAPQGQSPVNALKAAVPAPVPPTPADIGRSGSAAAQSTSQGKLLDALRDSAAESTWPTPTGDYAEYVQLTHQAGRSFSPLAAMREWAQKGQLEVLMANKTWASALGGLYATNRTELESSNIRATR